MDVKQDIQLVLFKVKPMGIRRKFSRGRCRVALTKVSEPASFVSTADKFVTKRWRTG